MNNYKFIMLGVMTLLGYFVTYSVVCISIILCNTATILSLYIWSNDHRFQRSEMYINVHVIIHILHYIIVIVCQGNHRIISLWRNDKCLMTSCYYIPQTQMYTHNSDHMFIRCIPSVTVTIIYMYYMTLCDFIVHKWEYEL